MPDYALPLTARYRLKEFAEADRDAFVACQTHPAFSRFYLARESGAAQAHAVFDLFLMWQAEQPRRNFQFAIVRRSGPGTYAGSVGLRLRGQAVGQGELGIEIVPSDWRIGAATEVMQAFLPWARAVFGITTFTAETAAGNVGAGKLAEQAGLRLVSCGAKHFWRSSDG